MAKKRKPSRPARKPTAARKGKQSHAVERESRYRSLVEIGIALSQEKELQRMLDLILIKALETTGADAASIYLVENIRIDTIGNAAQKFYPVLRLHRSANRTVGPVIQDKILSLDATSIAGYVASTGDSVKISDCYELDPNLPYTFNREVDKEIKYRTKSMLAVPLRSATGKIRGVLQMINKLQSDHEGCPLTRQRRRSGPLPEQDIIDFSDEDAELMRVFASQATVSIENTKLTEDIENLFESFIRASVTAIEARDPATSGHSDRVAVLTVELALAVHQTPNGQYAKTQFSEQQIRELRYASLLHDFGKIGVREAVLTKRKKLFDEELDVILLRLDSARARHEMQAWRELALELVEIRQTGRQSQLSPQQIHKKVEAFNHQLHELRMSIVNANQPQIVGEDFDISELMTWITNASKELGQSILTPEEMIKLSLAKGTLHTHERREIESHVSHTYHFLRQIAWTEDLSAVADIAHCHHEKVDGSGYPRGLTGEHIPVQSKIMTIADIYDALTAMDRPYKKAASSERALQILEQEVKEGKLDQDLLRIFIEAGIYRRIDGMIRGRKAS